MQTYAQKSHRKEVKMNTAEQVAFCQGKLNRIKIFAMDFDGIHTDGKVYTDQKGKEMVVCSRKDGLGIEMLKKGGFIVCVISKETNPVVKFRCEKLGITCFSGITSTEGKLEILKRVMTEAGYESHDVLYMGDDINDRECLEFAGIAVTVADGHPSVKKICDIVTEARGGDHAIREVAEYILRAQGYDPDHW